MTTATTTTSTNAVIVDHPALAQLFDLIPELTDLKPKEPDPEPDPEPEPEPEQPKVKREPGGQLDPEIYVSAVPPLPAGWCQPDFAGPQPPMRSCIKQQTKPMYPPPSPPITEVAACLAIALSSGFILGASVSFLLSKRTVIACGE